MFLVDSVGNHNRVEQVKNIKPIENVLRYDKVDK